jgi:predicted aspartyl protease
MIAYDNKLFDPPALILPVTVTGVVNSRPRARLQAIIDTGADVTAIPANLEHKLYLYAVDRLQIEDVRGIATQVNTYDVRLAIAGQTAKEIEVILTSLELVVLGRDWLQDYYLLLNGPEQNFLLSSAPIIETK